MRKETYEKIACIAEKYNGYMKTAELLSNGITNRQIAEFVDEGVLERVSTGVYWMISEKHHKPENYKMIEAAIINPKSVICAESACYYWGLMKKEPSYLSVATKRSDRCSMQMNFPVSRHYLSEQNFDADCHRVTTDYGIVNIYSMDRSVCECIYFKDQIAPEIYSELLSSYLAHPQKNLENLYKHAAYLRVSNCVANEIENHQTADEKIEQPRRRRCR